MSNNENVLMGEETETSSQEFENWMILEGRVTSPPVKVTEGNNIFYNFRIDNNRFRMNCTITEFADRASSIEEDIFESLKDGTIVKVSGKLFLKKKEDKLWVQINVKNWVSRTSDNRQIKYKV